MIIAYQIQMILDRQFFVTISCRTIAPYWLHGKLNLLQELSLLLIPKQDGTIHQKNCKHIIIIFKYWVKKVTNIRTIGKKELISHLQSTRASKSIWRNLSILNSFDNPKRITAKSLQIGAGKSFRKHKWKINKSIKHLISSSMCMVVRNTLYPSKYPKLSLETYQKVASEKFYAN